MMSPAVELVQPFEAMRLGNKYVVEHPGTDFLVGSGNSMLPLYKDHTVLVMQRIAMSELRVGMTAVYVGDSGWLVAHVLVNKTPDGWIAKGVGNAGCDPTLVTEGNLLGVVVKAFEPSSSLLAALLNEATLQSSVASTSLRPAPAFLEVFNLRGFCMSAIPSDALALPGPDGQD
jgi:hypothetical protein